VGGEQGGDPLSVWGFGAILYRRVGVKKKYKTENLRMKGWSEA